MIFIERMVNEMKYEVLNKLMPDTPNPESLQEKIDAFQSRYDVDEDFFNEILSEAELFGFSKGIKVGLELQDELENK